MKQAKIHQDIELFIQSSVVEPIVDHLKTHTGKPSTSELMEVIGFPSREGQCQYKFTIRKRLGERCTKKAMEGSLFCKACRNKKSSKKQEEEWFERNAPPNPEKLPDGMPKPPASGDMSNQIITFSVKDVGPNLYLEPNHRILMRTIEPNCYVAIGHCPGEDLSSPNPLAPQHIEFCKKHRVSIVDPTSPEST